MFYDGQEDIVEIIEAEDDGDVVLPISDAMDIEVEIIEAEEDEHFEVIETEDDDDDPTAVAMSETNVALESSSVVSNVLTTITEEIVETEESSPPPPTFTPPPPPLVSVPPVLGFHVTTEQEHAIPIPITTPTPPPPPTTFTPAVSMPDIHVSTLDVRACMSQSSQHQHPPPTPYPQTVVSAYRAGAYSVSPVTEWIVHPGPPMFDPADPMRALMNTLTQLMDTYQDHKSPEVLRVLCEHTGGKLPAPDSKEYARLRYIASYLLMSGVSYVSNGLCKNHLYHHSAPITTPLGIPLYAVTGPMGGKELRCVYVRTFIIMFGEGDHKVSLLTKTLAKMGYVTGAATCVGVHASNDPFEYVTLLTRDEYKAVSGVGMAGSGVWHHSSSPPAFPVSGSWASGRYGVDTSQLADSQWSGASQIGGFVSASDETHARYTEHANLIAESTVGIMFVPSFMASVPSYVHHIAYRVARDISGCLPAGTFQRYDKPLRVCVAGAGGIVKPRRFVFPEATVGRARGQKRGASSSSSSYAPAAPVDLNEGYSGQWYHSTQYAPVSESGHPTVPLTPPVVRQAPPSSSASPQLGSTTSGRRTRQRSRSGPRSRKSHVPVAPPVVTAEADHIGSGGTSRYDGHIPAIIPYVQVGTLDDNIVNLNVFSGPASLFAVLYLIRKVEGTSPLIEYIRRHGGLPWTMVSGFYADGKETIDSSTDGVPLYAGFPCRVCTDLVSRVLCCCGEYP